MKKDIRFESKLLSVAIASLFSLALPAVAQDAGKPAGIPWGPVVAYPEVDLGFKSDDNIYSQHSSRSRSSSNIFVVAPKIKLEAKDGPHVYDVGYKVENGSHSFSSTDNYTDQALSANAAWKFSGRSGLKLGAEYMLGHDARGSVPGVGHNAPDEYHQTSLNALYGYGADGAQGRFEVEAGWISKRFDNFRFDAASNPDNTKRDRDDTKLGGTFFWRIAPKTQLVLLVAQTNYDYKASSFAGWTTLDSTDRKYQAGVTWEATANTTGIFKVGTVRKNFSDAARNDFSQSGWEGAVKWSPLTYSNFDFVSSRLPSESTVAGASRDTRHGATWNHVWSSQFSTALSYNLTESTYEYSATDTRPASGSQKDKTSALGLKLNYKWTRIVKLGVGYDRTDKTSSNFVGTDPGYKKNIYSIFLNAAI
ncbi:MAG: outer membrane beta-barrel protein [Rhodocyclales bacterium]|nr:outer membrane beta-barrel protein [Rhodocyclales bacterium]